MRIDTSEPSLTALFNKGQVGLIRTEFMRKDDVIANTNELLEIYKKENAALQAENERLRKAGDAMHLAHEANFRGHPYTQNQVEKAMKAWRAAKGVQS